MMPVAVSIDAETTVATCNYARAAQDDSEPFRGNGLNLLLRLALVGRAGAVDLAEGPSRRPDNGTAPSTPWRRVRSSSHGRRGARSISATDEIIAASLNLFSGGQTY
jgi:hypothetical protein